MSIKVSSWRQPEQSQVHDPYFMLSVIKNPQLCRGYSIWELFSFTVYIHYT